MKKPQPASSAPSPARAAPGEALSPVSSSPQLSTLNLQPPSIPDHELLRRIGGGSYGEVWLARNALGAYRAVKIVHRITFDHDRPFEREFTGIQKFEPISRSHEGLVDLLQVGRNDVEGYFYYVMELADDAGRDAGCQIPDAGLSQPDSSSNEPSSSIQYPESSIRPDRYVPKTLKRLTTPPTYPPTHLLTHPDRLPLDECIQLGLHLTNALAYLHGQGLVHRDIKPSNIIFVGGVPKLADVGLVTGVDEARSYVGTEGFIPPEGPGSPQADLYSLGIVLYEMSTGKSHQDFPEPLPDLAAQPDHTRWLEFNAVVHKACRAEVRERYQSATQMQADLTLLQCGQSVREQHVWQQRVRIFRRIGLTAAAVVLATAGVAFLWQTISRHGQPAVPLANEDAAAGTRNPKAAGAYKLGQHGLRRGTAEGFRLAMENFTEAIEADPKFVAAHARLFEIHLMSEDHDVDIIAGKTEKLKELSDRLVKMAPTNAETHAALAIVLFLNEWKWAEAENEFKQALKLDRNCRMALTYYGYFLTRQRRAGEARTVLERALALDLTSPLITKFLGHCEYVQRHYKKALPFYEQASVLEPNYPSAHYWAGRVHLALTNYPQALHEFEERERGQSANSSSARQRHKNLLQALDKGGPRGYWMKCLEMDDDGDARFPYWYAECHARLGDKPKALARLQTALVERDTVEDLLVDEFWDDFCDDPKFKEIVRKVGLDTLVR